MAVPFTKFITRKWAVLTSKIDKLFIVIGITIEPFDFHTLLFCIWNLAYGERKIC